MRRWVCGVTLFLLSLSLWALTSPERRALADAATAQLESGQAGLAADNFEKALADAHRGERRRWLPLLGLAYEKTGRLEKALGVYQEAQELDPKSIDRLLDLGRMYAKLDLFEESIERYQKAYRSQPERLDVALALSTLLARRQRWSDARPLALGYVAARPEDADGVILLAEIEEALGEGASAALRRETVLAVHPTAEGWFRLGQLNMRLDQPDRAREAFEKALALSPENPQLLLSAGLAVWAEHPAQAVAYWRRVLTLQPEEASARWLLALEQFREGHTREALEGAATLAQNPSPGVQRWATSLLDAAEELSPRPKE